MANTAVSAAVTGTQYIAGVDFPSASLGIAVTTGVTAAATSCQLINGAPWWLPTILTSVDHATTWQVCCPATLAPHVPQSLRWKASLPACRL